VVYLQLGEILPWEFVERLVLDHVFGIQRLKALVKPGTLQGVVGSMLTLLASTNSIQAALLASVVCHRSGSSFVGGGRIGTACMAHEGGGRW